MRNFTWKWAREGNLSKLLGIIIFSLNLDVKEVSEFLVKKIQKKLKYWSSLHLHLDRRVLIVNAILVLHFGFLLLFGGGALKKAVKRCVSMLHNFQWVGGKHHTRARIN
jgi:hypothetical protein